MTTTVMWDFALQHEDLVVCWAFMWKVASLALGACNAFFFLMVLQLVAEQGKAALYSGTSTCLLNGLAASQSLHPQPLSLAF